MDILKEERPHLLELMPSYDTVRTAELRVNKYCVISIDENKYSVPDNLVGEFVFVKVYPEVILIYHKNELIAEHNRNYGLHTWNIKIEHYLKTLKKKPGALHSSTAIQQMNPTLQTIYNKYYSQDPKDFIELLELISEKGLEKLSPTSINTEKIKMLSNRNQYELDSNTKEKEKATEEIEKQSKTILKLYGKLLNQSAVAFDKEAKVIWLKKKTMKI